MNKKFLIKSELWTSWIWLTGQRMQIPGLLDPSLINELNKIFDTCLNLYKDHDLTFFFLSNPLTAILCSDWGQVANSILFFPYQVLPSLSTPKLYWWILGFPLKSIIFKRKREGGEGNQHTKKLDFVHITYNCISKETWCMNRLEF